MEHTDIAQQSPRHEITRLSQELEQAHVALEDAHAEIAALSQEREALLRRLAAQDASLARAHSAALDARQKTATALAAAAAHKSDAASSEAEKLKVSLEETSILAEELQQANEALLRANERLDERIAERTNALDATNAKLERLNADLQRRIEHETAARVEAQAELFKLQKLEAIGQLTGGIAHDFNNLLTVIISGLQLLGCVKDATHQTRVLRRTEEAAWRGAQLTQRLLAFARRQTLTPDRLDLSRDMSGIRELLRQGLRENIEVRSEIAEAVWPVEVDVGALELALLNLAVNARDAMPDGGRLVLSAVNCQPEPAEAERLGIAPNDYVDLCVSDSGTGMPPELVEKVFEPFFTTKEGGKGTGLGLAQVYGFVKQSGGAAWVESRPGEGTSVHLLLPRSLRPEPQRDDDAKPLQNVPKVPERLSILVVEDDDTVAAIVLDMLAQLGHSGTRVSTVASALAVLTGPQQVDLVFSDVLLPGGGSGLDLAREIGRRRIDVPMILTSGYGGGVTHRLATAKLPFLRKPYHLDALRDAIVSALAPIPAGTAVGGARISAHFRTA